MNKIFGFGVALLLVFGLGSCKPKQSAYKAVYEAAKQRELQENASAAVTPPPVAVSNDVTKEPTMRSEKITAVNQSDAPNLKAYSVVVASLSVKPNADALKARLERDGLNVILPQNEQGLYRVIVASYDNKVDAVEKRNQIIQKYSAIGDVSILKRTYGIPFDDLWILRRLY